MAELTLRVEQAEERLCAKRKAAAELRELCAKLERKLAAQVDGFEAEKTSAVLAYFEERSDELVSMGSGLMKEGRDAGWSQCKDRVLALFKVKFPDLDPSQIDPDVTSE